MKNSKIPIFILVGLLVVCVIGFLFVYSAQSGKLSDLQSSESELLNELADLKIELSDKETQTSILIEDIQSFTNQIESLKSDKQETIAQLEKVESTLKTELLRRDDWAKSIDAEKIRGNWTTVNLVDKEIDFDPSQKASHDLFLKGLKFYDTTVSFDIGENSSGTSFWVDDQVYDEQSAMGFMLKEIDGVEYLFIEWKGNDVVKHSDIGYYVLKKSE